MLDFNVLKLGKDLLIFKDGISLWKRFKKTWKNT